MIINNSKKILKYMLDQVISAGNLNADFFINCSNLAKTLDIENENLCRVCCQYLDQHKYINVIRCDDDGSRLVRLTATGIDFIEST